MMSTLKSTIKLCLIALILRASFARKWKRREDTSVQKLATNVQEAVTRILTDFEPAGRNHTKVDNWVLVIAEQVSGEELENAIIAKTASINDVTLTAELVSLTDGYHLIVPMSDDGPPQGVETKQRITAIAVVNMLTNLKTMQRVDTILGNCSLRSTIDFFYNGTASLASLNMNEISNKGDEHIEKFFGHWLQSVATILENDPLLSEEFVKCKNEAEAELNGTGNQPTNVAYFEDDEEMLAKSIANSRRFRQAALNRLFLRHASGHMEMIDSEADRKRFLLARALIELASHRGADVKLNQLYRDALAQTAENISEFDTTDEMQNKFFARLIKIVERDGELSESIKSEESQLSVWIAFRELRRSIVLK